jgi:hypothetical protein
MKQPNLDGLGRRRRFEPQPDLHGRTISPTENNYQAAAKVAHYGAGGLPTWAIYPLTDHTSYKSFENRMTDLRHAKFYEVDHFQFQSSPFAKDKALLHRNPIINQVGKTTMETLRSRGVISPYIPEASSSKPHDAYATLLHYSFDRLCPPGWTFTMHHEVLEPLKRTAYIEEDGMRGKPDFIGIIKNPVREILIFNETDRNTEPNKTVNGTRRSWDKKIAFYRWLNKRGADGRKNYQRIFNFDGAMIVTINTVSYTNLTNIMKVVEEEFGGGCNYIMGQYCEGFGKRLEFPNDPFDVYNAPWMRAGYEPYVFAVDGLKERK